MKKQIALIAACLALASSVYAFELPNGVDAKVVNTREKDGTIVLNPNMTGHITATLQSKTVHDTDFIWSAYESKSGSSTYKYLTLKNADTSSLNGEHELKKLSETQFTLKGYLAFGMPSETTWSKQ